MNEFTYKQETRTVATAILGHLNGKTKEITEFIIRDGDGSLYATAPKDWTEADVAAQVAHLNSLGQE